MKNAWHDTQYTLRLVCTLPLLLRNTAREPCHIAKHLFGSTIQLVFHIYLMKTPGPNYDGHKPTHPYRSKHQLCVARSVNALPCKTEEPIKTLKYVCTRHSSSDWFMSFIEPRGHFKPWQFCRCLLVRIALPGRRNKHVWSHGIPFCGKRRGRFLYF